MSAAPRVGTSESSWWMTAMPRAAASRGVARAHRDAVELDGAVVVGVGAAQDLDQGGLAGAVLAAQHVHLGAPGVEVDVGEDRHRAEALADPAHAEKGSGRGLAVGAEDGAAGGRRLAHCIARRYARKSSCMRWNTPYLASW